MQHTIKRLNPYTILRSNLDYRIERGFTLLPTVEDIRRLNEECGKFFFSTGASRFFSSRILDVCCPMRDGSTLFITSERRGFDDPTRVWTVRRAFANGDIETVGEFGEHTTRAQAVSAMKSYRSIVESRPTTKKNRAVEYTYWVNGSITVRIVNASKGVKGPTVTTHTWYFHPGDTRPAAFPTDLWDFIVGMDTITATNLTPVAA
jgi:hypothetical protein